MPNTNKTLLFLHQQQSSFEEHSNAELFQDPLQNPHPLILHQIIPPEPPPENPQIFRSQLLVGQLEDPQQPQRAEKKLALLRRDYAKQVKNVRKEYIHEMELLRLEKLRKEEARKEAIRVANEERKRLKAEAARVRAQERIVAEEEFRQTLLKERAEKLENWRMKQTLHENKKKEAKDLVRRRSSMWIEEQELESKIFSAIVF
ncbi:hypothetical protein ES319_A10G135900v1 [Gossypium barbadense]|uniref:Uncharacterized protein n=1 Tax=Gossypium barbadense TaxID=3634 RepID=A0A2P5YDM8_GOSBA|nr:hypothetical protein ES319_A10G135900v1 [Gossypium barbadense]PPS13712.1 hypothetical protein GOBAR_AA06869 [Gossypium barbadense]